MSGQEFGETEEAVQSSGKRRWFPSQRQDNEIIYLKAWPKVVLFLFFKINAWLSKYVTVDYTMAFRVKISGF